MRAGAGIMTGTAIVTGANGGIGCAIANRLHDDGVAVIATDVARDPSSELSEGIDYVGVDLRTPGDFDSLLGAVGASGLDYLVNAAGVALLDRDGSIVDVQDDHVWAMTLDVNLHAVRRLVAAAVPQLRIGRGKSIVTVASVAGIRCMDSPLDAYQVSKAAVVSLSRAMALRLAPEGIRCNTVCPGAILTPMITPIYERSPERKTDMERRTPLARLGLPADVAGATRFLLSPDAAFVTATELVVDGGWSAQLR